MLHAGGNRGADQGVAGERVVRIIIKRLLDALRNHDRAGEMHDRANILLRENAVDQRAVGDVSLEEWDVVGHDRARAVRKVVDDGDRPAGILQRKDGVAADIAGTAGDEDWDFAHVPPLTLKFAKVGLPGP